MELTEVTKFRRAVLTGLARFTWQGTLPEHIYDILYSVVTEDSPRVRCCVHKERAVLKNRINMALGLTVGLNIVEALKIALTEPVNKALPIIDVLPEACDQCPIDKFLVTDACRHCVAHKCMNKCPKKAITIHQNRAYIDKTKCIECGMCKKFVLMELLLRSVGRVRDPVLLMLSMRVQTEKQRLILLNVWSAVPVAVLVRLAPLMNAVILCRSFRLLEQGSEYMLYWHLRLLVRWVLK